MTPAELKAALKVLIETYDKARAAWIALYGDNENFDAWFTGQVLTKKEQPE